MNLEGLCRHLRNWFFVENGEHADTFTVDGGSISLPFLRDGQYFVIVGSLFNDGVHKYPAIGLTDETFNGTIYEMAVPRDVISLLDDITAWETKYREASESPYESESFGGYTYTKSSNKGGASGSASWKGIFRDRLNAWRKL